MTSRCVMPKYYSIIYSTPLYVSRVKLILVMLQNILSKIVKISNGMKRKVVLSGSVMLISNRAAPVWTRTSLSLTSMRNSYICDTDKTLSTHTVNIRLSNVNAEIRQRVVFCNRLFSESSYLVWLGFILQQLFQIEIGESRPRAVDTLQSDSRFVFIGI